MESLKKRYQSYGYVVCPSLCLSIPSRFTKLRLLREKINSRNIIPLLFLSDAAILGLSKDAASIQDGLSHGLILEHI